jgi:hypothetical protein
MDDFFRRYSVTPLVQEKKLDAGERVLQRVSNCWPLHIDSSMPMTTLLSS